MERHRGLRFLLLLEGLIIGGMMLPLPCLAQAVRMNVHGPSWHSDETTANNHTWGGGMEVIWTDRSWQHGLLGGGFTNSDGRRSLYLGAFGVYSITTGTKVGLGFAAATGYDVEFCVDVPGMNGDESWCYNTDHTYNVLPMLWPFISLGRRVQLRILASPFRGGMGHLVLSVRLW